MVLKALGIKGTDAVFYHSTKRDRVVFVDEVPPSLVCPVCCDVFLEPRVAPCGHSLCDACVQKVNRQTGKCFSCSEAANPEDFMVDNVSAVALGDLRVLCRNALGLREVDEDAQVDAPGAGAAGSSSLQPGAGRGGFLQTFSIIVHSHVYEQSSTRQLCVC
jgi:TNF receptor-associated factor 4